MLTPNCPYGHGQMYRLNEEPTATRPDGLSQPTWRCWDCGCTSIYGVAGNQISVSFQKKVLDKQPDRV